MNTDYIETRTLIIEALCPVVIKSGAADNDYGTGYIRQRNDDDFIYVIDAQKLQTEIFKHGESIKKGGGLEFVEKFTDSFVNEPKKDMPGRKGQTTKQDKTLSDFLDEIGFDYRKNINRITKGKIHSGPKKERNATGTFISAGEGKYFIPGTSIKGAIRTAVLYKMIKNDPNGEKFINDEFIKKLKKHSELVGFAKKKFLSSFDEGIISKYLQQKAPEDENKKRTLENDKSYLDILRAIKVSDSLTFTNVNKLSIKVLSGTRYKDFPINEEGFTEKAEFMITLDKGILKSFKRNDIPFSNIDELLKICEEFSQAQWEYEKNYIEKLARKNSELNFEKIKEFYNNIANKPTLRIGYGTGMLGTTIDLLLTYDNRKKVRDVLYNTLRDDETPKSRRFVVDRQGNPISPLSWVSITEKNENNNVEEKEIKTERQSSATSNMAERIKDCVKAEIINSDAKPAQIKIIEGEYKDKETILPGVRLDSLNLTTGSIIFVKLVLTKKKILEKAEYKGK